MKRKPPRIISADELSPAYVEASKARFLAKVKQDESGCWLWMGRRAVCGGPTNIRGVFTIKNRPYQAHRASFMFFNGPIRDGLFVCHTCDVPYCVNPKHLFLGTHLENMLDAARKGRLKYKAKPSKACRNGHPYTPETTRVSRHGYRNCLICGRTRSRNFSRVFRAANLEKLRAYQRNWLRRRKEKLRAEKAANESN